MLPDLHICEQARRSRDARFDGRFFVAVLTTGIYCRPVCPAGPPAAANVRFYPSAAAAEDAGYRPCLRCCPERAPETVSDETLVARALRAIDAGALDDGHTPDLAAALGVSSRHLGRLLQQHTGTTAGGFARTRRLHVAKRLIDSTELAFADVAMLAGYGSLRRFNEAVRAAWQRSPTELRRLRLRMGVPEGLGGSRDLVVHVPLREPYDRAFTLEFLQRRAVAGVETVSTDSYARHLRVGDEVVALHVTLGRRARVRTANVALTHLPVLLAGLRHLLDLDAEPGCIGACLAGDALLAPALARWPGMRVPGTLVPFELAVRAVLGQQVSVAAATTLATRLVQRFGTPLDADGWLFPEPAQLAGQDIAAAVGMPAQRGRAITELARRTAAGDICFAGADTAALVTALQAVPGIGAWTAQYIAMRALRDPNAFIEGDLIVRRALGFSPRAGSAQVLARAAAWQPWRAYAVMYLWRMSQSGAAALPIAPLTNVTLPASTSTTPITSTAEDG